MWDDVRSVCGPSVPPRNALLLSWESTLWLFEPPLFYGMSVSVGKMTKTVVFRLGSIVDIFLKIGDPVCQRKQGVVFAAT